MPINIGAVPLKDDESFERVINTNMREISEGFDNLVKSGVRVVTGSLDFETGLPFLKMATATLNDNPSASAAYVAVYPVAGLDGWLRIKVFRSDFVQATVAVNVCWMAMSET